MSWLPTIYYSIATLTPVVWLLMDDAHEAAATQAIAVVVVMLLVGGAATVLFVANLGHASVAQLGVAAVSLAGYLGVLGVFGYRVGLATVFEGIVETVN